MNLSVEGIPDPFKGAVDEVETNLVHAQVPGAKVLQTVTVQSRKVGTSVIQAQGLVRSANVGAVQGVVNAVVDGDDIGTAVKNGATGVQKAVSGDDTAPYVNPTTGKPVNFTAGGGQPAGSVPSVRRLGAIKTVTSTVQGSAKAVADSLNPSTP